MTQFLSLVVGGLFLGSIYALVALGFVTIFRATGVINFAQGSVLLVGAYLIGRLNDPLGFWPAVLVAVAAAALLSLLVDALLIRRVRAADLGTLAILTLGVDILLSTEMTREIGTDVIGVGAPWGADVVELAGIRVPTSRVIAGGVALGRRGRRDGRADGHPAQPRRRRRVGAGRCACRRRRPLPRLLPRRRRDTRAGPRRARCDSRGRARRLRLA